MHGGEEARAVAVERERVEEARAGERGGTDGADDRHRRADGEQRAADRAEEPGGGIGERRGRGAEVGQSGERHPLHADVDGGDDREVHQQRERHVSPRPLVLAGGGGSVLEAGVGEEDEDRGFRQAALARGRLAPPPPTTTRRRGRRR